jgi:hypothetical protein
MVICQVHINPPGVVLVFLKGYKGLLVNQGANSKYQMQNCLPRS